TNDGTTLTIGPGDAYEIPPGHVAWVEGDVPWESVEFTSGHAYGKSPEDLGARVLATMVFSDICDSTAMLERVGDAEGTRLLREHNERIRTVIDRFAAASSGPTATASSPSSTAQRKRSWRQRRWSRPSPISAFTSAPASTPGRSRSSAARPAV